MSLNQTYNLLSRIVAFCMIPMMLMASTGITYSVHYCHGNVTQVSILPEMVPSSLPCTCDIDRTSHESQKNQGIGKASCCKNLHYFQKVDIHSPGNLIKDVQSLTPECSIIINPNIHRPTELIELVKITEPFNLAPRAGYFLVIAYHQIRIPSPTSDC